MNRTDLHDLLSDAMEALEQYLPSDRGHILLGRLQAAISALKAPPSASEREEAHLFGKISHAEAFRVYHCENCSKAIDPDEEGGSYIQETGCRFCAACCKS